MSDTPRTDAYATPYNEDGTDWIRADFARQLERELTAAQAALAEAERRGERFAVAMRAVFAELDDDPPHGYGHRHETAGIWDSDNEPGIAGTKCEWCAKWSEIRDMLRAEFKEE